MTVRAFQPRQYDPPRFVAESLDDLEPMEGEFVGGGQCDGCGNSSYQVRVRMIAPGTRQFEAVCAVDPNRRSGVSASGPVRGRLPDPDLRRRGGGVLMTKVGDRVELVYCSDPYTKLEPGSRGIVSLIDSLGTVHVKWDSGSNLGLVPGEDSFRVIAQAVPAAKTAREIVREVEAAEGPREVGGAFDGVSVTSDADPGL